ncbi:MAG: ATP-binding protein [Breznakibacter sp.]
MSLLSNQPIPYHLHLNDRRFEEFVRDLYCQDIQQGIFGNEFDDITLLDGIREQGRDCILHKNGNNVGVIQCKRYKNGLNKPESAKEIIKFCLYSILHPNFIYDINTFEYHFVCSNGFSNPAVLFLKSFSDEILQEEDLEKWINQVIQDNKTLGRIDFDQIKNQLYGVLSNINIIPIIGTELDRRLSLEHNKNLYDKYFEVKKVVDNTELAPIREALDDLRKPASIYNHDLLEELGNASFTLYRCKNYFGNLTDSNIKRKETTELFDWIKSSLPIGSEKESGNILFLSGSAGCGKTTILRDLYELLIKEDIPVLGLKSDVLIANNLEDLRLKVNLTHPIVKSIIEISKNSDKIVVLIDQLDALSQYLSSKRDYINTYIQLIESLKNHQNIRVIASIREYDLNYDFSFHAYKSNKKIQVSELRDEDVENILSKLGLTKGDLTNTLFLLLRNPNNLDVFCRIYNNDTKVHEIKTLQDLYTELSKQLSQNQSIEKRKLRKLLYTIVNEQYIQRSITISCNNIVEDYPTEFSFLKSQGIIFEENNKSLRFFHQTFYDYLFAKKFIEEKGNLIDYIKTNKQSLESRSGLKMIISYISISDRKEYIHITNYILKSNKIRFHIKSLVISLLSNVENPLNDEKEIVLKLIKPNKKYYNVFIDSLISKGWTNWLIQKGFLKNLYESKPTRKDKFFDKKTKFSQFVLYSQLYKDYLPYEVRRNRSLNMATALLIRNLQSNVNDILNLSPSLEFEEKKQIVGRILYFNKDWTNPLAYDLFLYCKDSLDSYSYHHILENITPVNIDFVIKEIEEDVYDGIIEREKKNNRNNWYEKKKLLDLINKVSPEKSIIFLFEIVLSVIKSQEHLWIDEEDKMLVPDGLFTTFSVENDKSDYHTDRERIYSRLIRWIKETRTKNPTFYNDFVRTHYISKYHSILKIVLCVLDKPESDREDLVISIIERMYKINQISHHGELQGDLFRLIQLWFPTFCNKNKNIVLDIILSLKNNGELNPDKREGRPPFYSSFGLCTYLFLQALPLEYINSNIEAKKTYHELNRKFPKVKPFDYLYSSRFQMGGIGSPIKHNAYAKMTEEQWLRSFVKYNEDKILYSFTGGREQHAQRLEEEIKKQPSNFVSLIHKIIEDKNIHESYIAHALYALGESDLSNDLLKEIFVSAIVNKRYCEDKLFYITLSFKKIFAKGIDDEKLINFAIDLATSYPNPERRNDKDLYSSSINSIRGSSIEALFILDVKKHGKMILETLESVVQNANEDILSSVLHGLAYLNKYDIERAFLLFLSITENASDELFVHSFHSGQYYAHYDFSRLEPYLIRAKEIKDKQFRKNISAMLYFSWLRNYPKAESILFDYINNDPKCIGEVIHYAITNFYFEEDRKGEKAMFVLNKYLDYEDEHISHQYDCCFLQYKESNVKFLDLYSWVIRYVNSKSFEFKKYYILEYLLKNSAEYPDECFRIFKKIRFNQFKKEKETEYSFTVREHQMKLLIGFYNIFNADKKANRRKWVYINKIFDTLFEDISYKNDINKVLDLISK